MFKGSFMYLLHISAVRDIGIAISNIEIAFKKQYIMQSFSATICIQLCHWLMAVLIKWVEGYLKESHCIETDPPHTNPPLPIQTYGHYIVMAAA